MRSSIRVTARKGREYDLLFGRGQREAIISCLELMTGISQSTASLEVQVGGSVDLLREIEGKIRSLDQELPVRLSHAELHIVHSALLAAVNQFHSEEDFYIRMGFFRDNFIKLSRGIVQAVSGE
jgi:hypothetical protein